MKKLNETEKDWILSLGLEHKTMLMEEMLKDGQVGHYMQFTKVLLDAPLSEGGVSTEYIQKIFNKIINNENSKSDEKTEQS